MLTIKQQWLDYSEACLPLGTPDSTIESVRTTFYAGAMSVLAMLTDIQGSTHEETNAYFYRMSEEINEFNRKLHEEDKEK